MGQGVMGQADRLPDKFPEGTRFVIEGRAGRVSRYLEFPDGRHIDLPVRRVASEERGRARRHTAREPGAA
jgi:hypothetical protein